MSDVGIYVHVPFCLTRCGYCDFNPYAGLDHLAPRYVWALLAEAGLAAPAWRTTRSCRSSSVAARRRRWTSPI